MRSRSTTHPTVKVRHERRTRSNPRRVVRRGGGTHAAFSDIGLRRTVNQDAFLATDRLFAVADGVGGGPAGEVASGLAIEVLRRGAAHTPSAAELSTLAAGGAAAVFNAAQSDPALNGMSTTLTAGLWVPGGLAVAHAGDSRLYRLRAGAIEQVTEDHGMVAQMVAQGILRPERAATHPLRNMLTRALGRERDTDFDAFVVPAEPGDVFLFCTDGLTKMVEEPAIAAIVATARSLDDAALALVRAANAAGGRDNITVVLAEAPASLLA